MRQIYLLLFVFITSNLTAQKSGYSLVWQDEFNDAKMDSSKWRHRLPGALRVDGYNSIKNALVSTGNMLILATYNADSSKYFGGMIGTQETFQTTYGYFEASIKLNKKVGHWPAFWLQSPDIQVNCVNDPNTYGVEVDIMEYLRNNSNEARHTLHWDGYGACHKKQENVARVSGLGIGYHKFAVEWTATEYIFYVDDVETKRTSAAVSHRDEYLILSIEHGSWAGSLSPAQNPDTIFVDYVHVYKKELTEINEAVNNGASAFPNPCNDLLSLASDDIKIKQVDVYDVFGKHVKTIAFNFDRIDVSDLSHGFYIATVVTEEGIRQVKISKQ